MTNTTESHPLQPFLPEGARLLMLGSFPPKRERWSMDFFYPNWINDMWRIWGYIFFADKHYFEVKGEKRFDRERIVSFCLEHGIALYDTACEVRRLRDNASDKFLEIVRPTDIKALLDALPHCQEKMELHVLSKGPRMQAWKQLAHRRPRLGEDHQRCFRRSAEEPGPLQPHLHDGRLRRPWFYGSDSSAGRYAWSDGRYRRPYHRNSR